MSRPPSHRAIVRDCRAVTPVIGFILLFGLLVMLLAMYQAQIVPQQSAQAEFQHNQEVQNDLIELRNSISTAGQADRPTFTRINLGPTYETRVVGINPAPAAGTLRTSESYNITISNRTAAYDKNVSTRFLEYEPRYNELTTGSIWYEHSVLYVDERDERAVQILQNQNIKKNESEKVRLTALQNEFESSGTQRTKIELFPTESVNESDIPTGELDIIIPTRLNKSEYWADHLGNSVELQENYHANGVHRLNMSNSTVHSDNFEFNTVGLRENPIGQAKQNVGPSSQRDTVVPSPSVPETPDRFERGSGEYGDGEYDEDSSDLWDEDGNLVTGDLERDQPGQELSFFTAGNVNINRDLIIERQNRDLEMITFGDFYLGGRFLFTRTGQGGDPNILIETRGDTVIENEVVFENPEKTTINSLGSFRINDRFSFDPPRDEIFLRVDEDLTIEDTFEIDHQTQPPTDELDVHVFVDGEVNVGSVDFSNINLILYGDSDYQALEDERDELRDEEDFPVDQL